MTTNFADYAFPSAAELPGFELVSHETPSPLNPLGAKGIGESARSARPQRCSRRCATPSPTSACGTSTCPPPPNGCGGRCRPTDGAPCVLLGFGSAARPGSGATAVLDTARAAGFGGVRRDRNPRSRRDPGAALTATHGGVPRTARLEPPTTMAAVAAVTITLRLGTGIVIAPLHLVGRATYDTGGWPARKPAEERWITRCRQATSSVPTVVSARTGQRTWRSRPPVPHVRSVVQIVASSRSPCARQSRSPSESPSPCFHRLAAHSASSAVTASTSSP